MEAFQKIPVLAGCLAIMRHTVVDTETTGLDPDRDHLVEVAAVELVDNYPTGRTYHVYCNPGIPVPAEAIAVHGLTDAFLADKPPLDVPALQAFLGTDPIIAHNAPFDASFLRPHGIANPFIDTLALARTKHPRGVNTLDGLCRRYGVPLASRTKHGALIDAELLAAVYARLITEQTTIEFAQPVDEDVHVVLRERQRELPPRITAAEREAHSALVSSLNGSIWPDLHEYSQGT